MKFNLQFILIIILILGFTDRHKEKETRGILFYHLLVDNSLFFTEDTSFLENKDIKHIIKLTKIFALNDNEYPFYSDSSRRNFSHFKILKIQNSRPNDSAEDVYYARIKVVFPYLMKNTLKKNDYTVLVNGKKVTFRIYNASEPTRLIYE